MKFYNSKFSCQIKGKENDSHLELTREGAPKKPESHVPNIFFKKSKTMNNEIKYGM